MSFLSRTLTSAFVDTAELFTAIENTKLMWTQRQRQMAKDALKAAGWQFHLQNDLVDEFSDGDRQFDRRTPPKGVGTPPKGVSCTPLTRPPKDVLMPASDRSPRCPGCSTGTMPRVFRG